MLLIDEVLTPDSSRFWDMAAYQPGRIQDSFDKQPLRESLRSIGWNKEPAAPELPPHVVAQTRDKYLEAYRRLVGGELDASSSPEEPSAPEGALLPVRYGTCSTAPAIACR